MARRTTPKNTQKDYATIGDGTAANTNEQDLSTVQNDTASQTTATEPVDTNSQPLNPPPANEPPFNGTEQKSSGDQSTGDVLSGESKQEETPTYPLLTAVSEATFVLKGIVNRKTKIADLQAKKGISQEEASNTIPHFEGTIFVPNGDRSPRHIAITGWRKLKVKLDPDTGEAATDETTGEVIIEYDFLSLAAQFKQKDAEGHWVGVGPTYQGTLNRPDDRSSNRRFGIIGIKEEVPGSNPPEYQFLWTIELQGTSTIENGRHVIGGDISPKDMVTARALQRARALGSRQGNDPQVF